MARSSRPIVRWNSDTPGAKLCCACSGHRTYSLRRFLALRPLLVSEKGHGRPCRARCCRSGFTPDSGRAGRMSARRPWAKSRNSRGQADQRRAHPRAASEAAVASEAPVRFSVFREFGKVVVEGRVDDTVRCDCSASEAVQILGRTAMHVGACRDESRRRVRAARPNTTCPAAISSGRWRN